MLSDDGEFFTEYTERDREEDEEYKDAVEVVQLDTQ